MTCLHKLLGLTETVIDPGEVLGYCQIHASETSVYLLVETNHLGPYRRASADSYNYSVVIIAQ